MKKFIFICISISCLNETSLGRFCPTKCFSGSPENKNIGECKEGKPVCDTDFNVIECRGEILPSEETCNGKDDDCDNHTDDVSAINQSAFREGTYGLEHYPCFSLGECRRSVARCIAGSWVCSYPTTVELNSDGNVSNQENRCDGLDGSCDGRIDENISYEPPFCFDGTISQATNPPCRVGVWSCKNGERICEGQVLSSMEICGDQIDNDCDGIKDNTPQSLLNNYDIVFIVDTSGSMYEEINAVSGALNAYSEQFDGNVHYRFALVVMSSLIEDYVRVISDFTDFSNIRFRIQLLQSNGSGYEASLDSMYYVCLESNPLFLSWRFTDTRKMAFMFTDEPAQSYTNPLTTKQMIIDACIISETSLFIWSANNNDFAPISQGTGGIHFNITYDWEEMFYEMNGIIFQNCE